MINLKIKNNDSLTNKWRGNQSGRSMIEMLGVLAIIGVLSVGGIAGYSKAMTKYRVNKTIEQITLIAGNIRTFFASQGNYAGLTFGDDTGMAIIKKAKLLPDEMWDSDKTSPQNVWGSNISIYPDCRNETECDKNLYRAFSFEYYGIPEEACIELLSYDWSTVGVTCVYTDTDAKYVESVAKVPLSLQTAIDFCGNLDPESGYVSFVFDVDFDFRSDGLHIYE